MSTPHPPLETIYLRPNDRRAFLIRPFLIETSPAEIHEPPHRHDFQEILWIRSGHGEHLIDGQTLRIQPGTFYLIARGQVHQLVSGFNIDGLVIRFSDAFLPDYPTLELGHYQTTLFTNHPHNHTLTILDEERPGFETLLEQLVAEFAERGKVGQYQILRYLLTALLIKLGQVQRRIVQEQETAVDPDHALYQQFTNLLEQRFTHTHAVKSYAAALNVTPRHLSTVTRRLVGKTSKQLIEERIILEAKRQLTFTNNAIKEIAHALGYRDPAYFSRLFKKQTGFAPQQYKGDL